MIRIPALLVPPPNYPVLTEQPILQICAVRPTPKEYRAI